MRSAPAPADIPEGPARAGGAQAAEESASTAVGPTGPQEARARVRTLLAAVAETLEENAGQRIALHEHRPARDRASGRSWRGVRTLQHVSALIGSQEVPAGVDARRLLAVLDAVLAPLGAGVREVREVSGVHHGIWRGRGGGLVEVVVGVRLLVRVVSDPFLPGAEQGDAVTTPRRLRGPARA